MKSIDATICRRVTVVTNSRLSKTRSGDANSLQFCSSHSGETQWVSDIFDPFVAN